MLRYLFAVLSLCVCSLTPAYGQDSAPGPVHEGILTNRLEHGSLVLRVGAGRSTYTERATIDDVVADSDSNVLDGGLTYSFQHPTGFKLRGMLGGWICDSSTEAWRIDGQLVQKNDLEMAGLDLDGAFGLDVLGASSRELNLWVGLGFRSQGFERSRFRSYGGDEVETSDAGTIAEDYVLGLFTLGVDGRIPISSVFTAGGGATFGTAFFNEADNEALGTITGDGGKTLDVHAYLAYALSDRDSIGAGFRYRFQELEGNVSQGLIVTPEGLIQAVSEWPDNELEQLSAELFWTRAL